MHTGQESCCPCTRACPTCHSRLMGSLRNLRQVYSTQRTAPGGLHYDCGTPFSFWAGVNCPFPTPWATYTCGNQLAREALLRRACGQCASLTRSRPAHPTATTLAASTQNHPATGQSCCRNSISLCCHDREAEEAAWLPLPCFFSGTLRSPQPWWSLPLSSPTVTLEKGMEMGLLWGPPGFNYVCTEMVALEGSPYRTVPQDHRMNGLQVPIPHLLGSNLGSAWRFLVLHTTTSRVVMWGQV